jgi:myo-inositol-1(or 4)-monophosphatase
VRSDLAPDLDLAVAAARQAGAIALSHFGTALDVTNKAPGQPVTIADLETDALLRRLLHGARPGYGWLSEETADGPDRSGRRRVWIVDPIDGTRSFVSGRPEFAVSVGLAEDGVAVAGVVFNPATDELYYGLLGGGAHLAAGGGASVRLRVTDAVPATGLAVLASRTDIAAGDFAGLPSDWRLEPLGSTAYKMARVAAGRADAFLSRSPKNEWDVCAGVLIVAEAGGRVTDLSGAGVPFNRPSTLLHGILASNGMAHAGVLAAASAAGRPTGLHRPTPE